ncbi:hypothetical protein QVD17_08883 [Tagetes erecta]|uniref:Uncharacterized protein n=1 Tax=Tagetes erecta TaxID=13708 RepID=A0AAD8P4T6_TARER|nr:hypothetical protein QVD17_08883 [Tagetes erecta]
MLDAIEPILECAESSKKVKIDDEPTTQEVVHADDKIEALNFTDDWYDTVLEDETEIQIEGASNQVVVASDDIPPDIEEKFKYLS